MRFTRIQFILWLYLQQLNQISDVLAESSKLQENDNPARIIGGIPANIQKHPHAAALMYIDNKQGVLNYQCGCTIVGSVWAVTSARCLWRIRKGAAEIHSNSSFWNKDYIKRPVIERVVHKKFNPRTLDWDIGMLKVKRAFKGKYERELCLFDRIFEPNANSKVTLVGWGKTETESFPRHLRAASLFITDRKKCQNVWRGHTHEGCTKQGRGSRAKKLISRRQICAGAPGKDACRGDAGSPLIQNDCLIGFVSWGSCKCDGKGRPGVYTNVNYFRFWMSWVKIIN